MDAMMQACQKAIGCMLFEGVEQAQTLHLLQTYAQLQTFEKGQIIYSPGHYQHSLGIIVRGRAVVEKECGVLLNALNGVGEDYNLLFDKLQEECGNDNMPLCSKIIDRMKKKASENMGYYQFFAM